VSPKANGRQSSHTISPIHNITLTPLLPAIQQSNDRAIKQFSHQIIMKHFNYLITSRLVLRPIGLRGLPLRKFRRRLGREATPERTIEQNLKLSAFHLPWSKYKCQAPPVSAWVARGRASGFLGKHLSLDLLFLLDHAKRKENLKLIYNENS
jgi:hypothetical protein